MDNKWEIWDEEDSTIAEFYDEQLANKCLEFLNKPEPVVEYYLMNDRLKRINIDKSISWFDKYYHNKNEWRWNSSCIQINDLKHGTYLTEQQAKEQFPEAFK